jgi:hypothetical protein
MLFGTMEAGRARMSRGKAMKQIELWRWRYFDQVRKRMVTTRCVLNEADARIEHPDAVKVEGAGGSRGPGEANDEAGYACEVPCADSR